MIDFKTVQVGDKVKVVGLGAPGYAALGDELEIVKVGANSVDTKRTDGKEANFFANCGAKRLELLTTESAIDAGDGRGES